MYSFLLCILIFTFLGAAISFLVLGTDSFENVTPGGFVGLVMGLFVGLIVNTISSAFYTEYPVLVSTTPLLKVEDGTRDHETKGRVTGTSPIYYYWAKGGEEGTYYKGYVYASQVVVKQSNGVMELRKYEWLRDPSLDKWFWKDVPIRTEYELHLPKEKIDELMRSTTPPLKGRGL